MAADEAVCRNFSAANLQWPAAAASACMNDNCGLQRLDNNYTLVGDGDATLSSLETVAAAAANVSLMMGDWAQYSGLQNFVLVLTTYVTPIFVGVGLVSEGIITSREVTKVA